MLHKRTESNFIAIDIARGFAALSVFVYHYGVGTVLDKSTGWSAFSFLAVPGATYAVPLFFALSGFCIHWSQLRQEQKKGQKVLDLQQYVIRRFWRIYPAYFVALLFSCTLSAMEGSKVSVWDFLVHVVLLQGFSVESFNSLNLVLWTISIEALLYLLYPLWYHFRNLVGLTGSVCCGLTISLISWTVCAAFLFPYTLPEQWFVLNLWGGWLVGAWSAEQVHQNNALFAQPIWWMAGVSAILAVAICKGLGYFDGPGLVAWAGVVTILWVWPLTALILAEKWLSQSSKFGWWSIIKPLQLCGQFSYSLYLLHMPLMYLRNLLWVDIHSTITRTVIWGAAFLCILGISWLAYQIFEVPFMQYRIQKYGFK